MRIGAIVNKKEKQRINLSLDKEALEFAKKWSYVIQKPISHLVDEFFSKLRSDVLAMTPLQWLNPDFQERSLALENLRDDVDESLRRYEEILKDEEEAEYCRKHPESTRAKMRLAIMENKAKEESETFAEYEEWREKFIERWEATFPKK